MKISTQLFKPALCLFQSAFSSRCQQRKFNSSEVSSQQLSYSADVNKFLSQIETKTKPGFKFDWKRIAAAVAQAEAKINALPPQLAIEDQPLSNLPAGLPSEFQTAFDTLLKSQQNKGLAKVKRRIVLEQIIEQIVEAQNGKGQSSCALGSDGKNPRSMALNSFLKEFVIYKYGRPPEPLPDAFLTAVPFYGHLVEKESPFLDIAFAPGGSMAHKSAHSVNVHVMDFFELWLACEEQGSTCGGVKLKDLTIYVGLQGIVEALPSLKKMLKTTGAS